MHRFNDAKHDQHTSGHRRVPVARSYSEIARILAEREGAPISPAEVEHQFRNAERKLAHATRADPVIARWLAGVAFPPAKRS